MEYYIAPDNKDVNAPLSSGGESHTSSFVSPGGNLPARPGALFIDHEFRSLIPPLQPEEYAELERSLIVEGNRVPIDTWNGYIVDGHNRYDICHKHKIPLLPDHQLLFPTHDDAKIWIIRNQFGRRNLSPYQKSVLALRLEGLFAEKAKENEKAGGNKAKVGRLNSANPLNTREELSKIAHVGHDTIARVKVIEEKANDEQKIKLISGKATINFVYNQIRHSEKQKEDEARLATGKPFASLNGKYKTILIDPPWQYETNVVGRTRPPYATQKLEDIEAVDKYADDNCHLYLWTTNAFIPKACQLIEQWGFEYKTIITWVKPSFGLGSYFRNSTEHLLFAVKGHLSTRVKDIPTHFEASRNGHSVKPEISYKIIERASYPPFLQLYAQKDRDNNWTCAGIKI